MPVSASHARKAATDSGMAGSEIDPVGPLCGFGLLLARQVSCFLDIRGRQRGDTGKSRDRQGGAHFHARFYY